MGSRDESESDDGGGEESFRFLVFTPLLPGGFLPVPAASLDPAVGGRPSGLYCVPASTYPAMTVAEAVSVEVGGWSFD
jgi:hypothetical protein